MDWHFRQNKRQKDTTKLALSREWYLPKDEWICDEISLDEMDYEASTDRKGMVIEQEKEELGVIAEREGIQCAVCLEILDKFYDETTEEWMLKNTIKDEKSGLFYHSNCLSLLSNSNPNKRGDLEQQGEDLEQQQEQREESLKPFMESFTFHFGISIVLQIRHRNL